MAAGNIGDLEKQKFVIVGANTSAVNVVLESGTVSLSGTANISGFVTVSGAVAVSNAVSAVVSVSGFVTVSQASSPWIVLNAPDFPKAYWTSQVLRYNSAGVTAAGEISHIVFLNAGVTMATLTLDYATQAAGSAELIGVVRTP